MKTELELMDFKNIEQQSEETIRAAYVSIAMSKTLLFWAQSQIILLKGKTNDMINAETKKNK